MSTDLVEYMDLLYVDIQRDNHLKNQTGFQFPFHSQVEQIVQADKHWIVCGIAGTFADFYVPPSSNQQNCQILQ